MVGTIGIGRKDLCYVGIHALGLSNLKGNPVAHIALSILRTGNFPIRRNSS